jgi:transposase
MNDVAVVYVGVDVSKDSLRFDAGDFFTGDVKNKPAAIRSALKRLAGKLPAGSVPHVCYESTGRYGWDLAAACAAAGIPSSILNPCKVRQYARAMSVSAKTDPVDARMIRLFAEHRKPPADEPVTAAQAEMRELAGLRSLLMKQLVAMIGAIESARTPTTKRIARENAKSLKRRIVRVDKRLRELREEDARMSGIHAKLIEIKGVGETTATQICAIVPELGTLGRRRAASLAGLAPHPKDSGTLHAPRHISGGRPAIRGALFMAALTASRYEDEVLGGIYKRMVDAGKPKKVALTCIMRKLFVRMDNLAAQWLRGQAGAESGPPAPATA